jgi:phosphoadenosine phosphosulfate reductase
MTGLRREQAATRAHVRKVEIDQDHGNIVKLNPLADWTQKQVWDYISAHGVPYNKLHDQGFPSIGCAPCTRAIKPWEDIRAGRWWWENPESKECGLHVRSEAGVGQHLQYGGISLRPAYSARTPSKRWDTIQLFSN